MSIGSVERWVKENLSSDSLAEIAYYHSNVEDEHRGIYTALRVALRGIERTNELPKLPPTEPEPGDEDVLTPLAAACWECETLMRGAFISDESWSDDAAATSIMVDEELAAQELRQLAEVIETPREAAWFALNYMG